MAKRRSSGRASRSVAYLGAHFVAAILGRLARHWFMFALFVGVCLAIRGSFGLEYGLPYLFREDPPMDQLAVTELYRSPSFLTAFLGAIFAGAIWVFAVFLNAEDATAMDQMPIAEEAQFFLLNVFITGALPVLALGMRASPAIPPLGDVEIRHILVGWLLGTIVATAIIVASRVVDYVLESLIKGVYNLGTKAFRRKRQKSAGDDLGHVVQWENVVSRVPLLWLGFLATNILVNWRFGEHPVVAVFGLLGYGLSLYVFMNFFVESIRLWIVGACLILPIVVAGHERFKYTFPGLETYYKGCDAAQERGEAGPHPGAAAVVPCERPEKTEGASFLSRARPQLTLQAALAHMPVPKTGVAEQKPKLVVVAASGGAYRATFWTALVLDRIRARSAPGGDLEGMAQSIRLLTGASGGMIATAYMATLPPDKVAPGTPTEELDPSLVGALKGDIAKTNELAEAPTHRGNMDSLSTVTQTLVQHDIFTPLWGERYRIDRGRALEQQWKSLDVPFSDLRRWAAEGSRPFIIVSPVIAQTGQPLLISNLDLPDILSPDAGCAAGPADPGRPNRSVDLFQAFPDAINTFRLATAVRMSATFPLVTPSVSLPTSPPVRVVDAGYFDNFGMSIALAYLKQCDVRELITQNTSGVIIIQINAYPVEARNAASAAADGSDGMTKDKDCRDDQAAADSSWAGRSLSSLTSALEGLFSARQASMIYRNDQELSAVQEIYRSARMADGRPFPFDSVVFENAGRASFSWYLTEHDLKCMQAQLDESHNLKVFDRLRMLWRGVGP